MAAAIRVAPISSPPINTAKDGLVSLVIRFCLRTRSCDSRVKAYWNPTWSVHVQARLPPVASHQQDGRDSSRVERKVRTHAGEWHVQAWALAVSSAPSHIQISWARITLRKLGLVAFAPQAN
jgi:hypothetical protein